MGNLLTPISVQKLQAALHAKAKAEPEFRFYALYDKLYRDDVLAHAYARCRANKGAPGVDGQTFDDIERYGRERWLGELALALREKRYQPEAIKRVFIPKANGKLRPLGLSSLRDRVCMMAAVVVLDPIFEADLAPEQYAYRAGCSAHDALSAVKMGLSGGFPEVVDADLSAYFDTIPHRELMLCVARRVVDGNVLGLVKSWLECAVEETDPKGRTTRTTLGAMRGKVSRKALRSAHCWPICTCDASSSDGSVGRPVGNSMHGLSTTLMIWSYCADRAPPRRRWQPCEC